MLGLCKCKYTEQATITASREYFSLGGCAGPETQIHRASHNNSFERIDYFSLGGCAGPERLLYMSRKSKPQ